MSVVEAGIGAMVTVVVAGIGAAIAYYFDRRKVAEEPTYAEKREHYKSLILCLKNLREGG
jgi:hypothetical protein